MVKRGKSELSGRWAKAGFGSFPVCSHARIHSGCLFLIPLPPFFFDPM